MTCIKPTAEGEWIVELFSGKTLTIPELADLDVNWRFLNVFVRVIKHSLAELPRTQGWLTICKRLPQTRHGGACNWQDIAILVLVAPFLTRNNIAVLCRQLERSPGLCALLGLTCVPSETRISIYKNHLLGELFFRQVRMHLLHRLQRQGHLPLDKLIIDGAPIWARVNPRKLQTQERIPRELIRRTFQTINLTWVDVYYPVRASRQTPTSTIVLYYLLMYWLGWRSLSAVYGWLTRHPEVLDDVGLPRDQPALRIFRRFQPRFRQFVHQRYGSAPPFQALDDLVRAVCSIARTTFFFTVVLRIDELRTNDYLFNLFRYQNRVSDPDAMHCRCTTRHITLIGYRVILIVDALTRLPLFGLVYPGNQHEGVVAASVLDKFVQSLSDFEDVSLPPTSTLFADLGYNQSTVAKWAQHHALKLFITSRRELSSRRSRWRSKHRVRVEHAFSDLTTYFGLSRPRTITLPYVQIFAEILFTARVAQALVAIKEGHESSITRPSYPAFG